jgi:hypothetical protein
MTRQPSTRPVPPVIVVALVVGVLAVLLTAFAWPAVRSAPHDVPLAVSAPPPVADQVATALDRARPGAFEVRTVADEDAARAAVLDREVYGAVVVGPDGATVLTASAAGPVVAQALGQVADGLGQALGAPVPVEDVVPLPDDDPRGAGLAAGALPLAIGGILTAGLLSRTVPGVRRRVGAALATAAGGGLVLTGLLQGWLAALSGSYWAVSGVLALGLAATALLLLGLHALAGSPGLGAGAAVVVLLGNPLSGASSAPEFLPVGWGQLGQLLTPGATVDAVRSVAFFDGAGAGAPLLVLTGWAAVGLLLCLAGALRARTRVEPDQPGRPQVPISVRTA